MTSTGKDALWSFLFASDCKLVNLKLMRGDSNNVTPQELRDEVHSALFQAKTSNHGVTSFPEEVDMHSVNIRELAATN